MWDHLYETFHTSFNYIGIFQGYMDVGGIMKIVLVSLDQLWAKNVSNAGYMDKIIISIM